VRAYGGKKTDFVVLTMTVRFGHGDGLEKGLRSGFADQGPKLRSELMQREKGLVTLK
jgi:hypothetical protein